ncbi:hypothetical protein [Hyalangium versicolor]|uniref:hypothetical protein n=1 Tax=Hyalangium versicolor TaxID=2861190 RepID=UPI001CCDDD01|nr:hypothetical protein [Hyalangium versicolor]
MPTESPSATGSTPSPATVVPEPRAVASDGWFLAACCLGAATVLGVTLQLSNGTLREDALEGLSMTLALCGVGVLVSRVGRWDSLVEGGLTLLLAGGLVVELHQWCMNHPGFYLQLNGPWPYAPFYWGLAAQALVVGALLASSDRLRPWLVPLLLMVSFSVGVWLLRTSPSPFIDVFVFQAQGSEALLRGHNPYAMTFPNIYGHAHFYGEGIVQNGRLMFGFPYPPLSLYFSVLGKVLGGDPRYAQLVAITLAAGFMAYARGGRLAAGAAALLLLTPRALFVLEMAWTEPLLIGLLAATVFCACRYPRALPYVLGLLVAVKQYTVFILPLIPLLTPLRGRQLWDWLWRAGVTAVVVSLPLIALNPKAFLWSVAELQFHQPFRTDALSYLSWWVSKGHPQPPVWIAFAGTGVAIALALWRAPRTPAGFAASVAFVYCVFFALNKQAFTNYYYFVLGALCIAVAARTPAEEPASRV